jgi:hypothetical protein
MPGACRPWRRAVIGNASCLRPRPDRFNPNLLIGFFFHGSRLLQYVPGPFVNVLASEVASTTSYHRTASSMEPAYDDELLSSRDGFLLLSGRAVDDLCLCNPLAGSCGFLPAAGFPASKPLIYALVTDDHDDCSSPPPTGSVWMYSPWCPKRASMAA